MIKKTFAHTSFMFSFFCLCYLLCLSPLRSQELQTERTLRGHSQTILALSQSKNGKYLVSGADDQKIILWKLQGEALIINNAHLRSVNAIDFSPDSNRFASGGSEQSQQQTISVLFVGNSLSYTNNLPKLVQAVGKEKGLKIKTAMLAKPNYALIDHWNDGILQKKIANGNFDFVVVQQGPSSQNEGKKLLLDAGKKIATLCSNSDSRLVFFMVWPSLQYYRTFEGVINNYREAALTNNAILSPVGEAWKAHFEATNNFDYYGPDGFHPSVKGSKVAADIIVSELIEKM